jgi:V8-like Glu-specific endopeptidase
MICGYPSNNYYQRSDLRSIEFERVPLYGKIDIIGETIYYNLDTKTGHSGSAIFGINAENSEPTILGIHTHKGKRNNLGVYLSYANLKRLAKF